MFTSICLLLLAIAIVSCQTEREDVIIIRGILMKDGIRLPFTSKMELEDNPTSRHFKDVCTKYDKMANTDKISRYKNFTCVVTGPLRGYLEAEFTLQFQSDEADKINLTKDDLENQTTGTGYDLTNIQLKLQIATREYQY
ncbi:unnamed protein product [Dicrocoelium dendriticum]|nr:unnamed protein product [Dicrocoelium dendriticum]